MEDDKIVSLYLLRDEAASSHTAEKYGSRLRALAQRITGDPTTAEESENDTYLEAWNRIPPHEPRTYLLAFLSRIVRNHALIPGDKITFSVSRLLSGKQQRRSHRGKLAGDISDYRGVKKSKEEEPHKQW